VEICVEAIVGSRNGRKPNALSSRIRRIYQECIIIIIIIIIVESEYFNLNSVFEIYPHSILLQNLSNFGLFCSFVN
jgi:hypothetical protein